MEKEKYQYLLHLDVSNINKRITEIIEDDDPMDRAFAYYLLFIAMKSPFATDEEVCQLFADETKFISTIEEFNSNHELLLRILRLRDELSDDEVLAGIAQAYGYETYEGVPESLSKLTNALFDIQPNQNIAQMEGGYFEYSIQTAIEFPNSNLFGIDEDYSTNDLAQIKANVFNVGNFKTTWIDGNETKYDAIFISGLNGASIDSSYFADLYESNKLNIRSYLDLDAYNESDEKSIWNQFIVAFSNLAPNGKIVSFINANSTTEKQTTSRRRFFVENEYVEGVIALPERMFEKNWSTPYVIIFSQKKNKYIKFYDARQKYVLDRINGKKISSLSDFMIEQIVSSFNAETMDDPCVAAVSIEEVARNDYVLSPQRYVSQENIENALTIGDIATDIKRGTSILADRLYKILSEEQSDEKCMKCLTTLSIERGYIKKVFYVSPDDIVAKKNHVKKGDIIFYKNGVPFKIAISDDDYVLVGELFGLVIDDSQMPSEYVKCYLESERGQKQIAKYAAGEKIKRMSIENLKKIQIPIPDNREDVFEQVKRSTVIIESSYRKIESEMNKLNDLFR